MTGRAKELIKRGGHGIDPGMIEDAFIVHPAVALAAAVGKSAYAGELPVAYVQLRPGAQISADALPNSPASASPSAPRCRRRSCSAGAAADRVGKVHKNTR